MKESNPTEIDIYLKGLFAGQMQYGFGIVLVKLSMLTLYCRVFPMALMSRRWRICWWLLFGVDAIFIVSTIAAIVQCRPIAYFWDRTIPGGHCVVNQVVYFRVTSVINIVIDVMILILPIPILSKLEMGRTKKIGLKGLFLLGGL